MSAPVLRLSVLDQSPVPDGFTPTDALNNSFELAQHVDALGYKRLWYSEHHSMAVLACTAPEILIARAAAATSQIRVGSGGVMLPHYSPFKVAEVFRTLHAMFPGRIDLGIGRAPGGGAREMIALRRNRDAGQPDDFPQQLAELLAFLHPERFPANHPFRNTTVAPAAHGAPDVWLLGSSMWSAVTAAREGLPYAFAHFFSPIQTRAAIEYYRANFQPAAGRSKPEATLAVGVICADTDEEAEYLASSVRLLHRRIRSDDRRPVATPDDAVRELGGSTSSSSPFSAYPAQPEEGEWPRYFVGTPDRVAIQLRNLSYELEVNEIIVNTITHSHEARLRSYSLLAEAMQDTTSTLTPVGSLAARV